MKITIKTQKDSMSGMLKRFEGINGKGVDVGIFDGEMAWLAGIHEYGCTIKPKRAQYLTVPVHPNAVGRKADSFNNTFVYTSDGEYEQLVGGVDTLFKGASSIVQKYANNAYKTAGISANAYMETVTSFSAGLIQSLGGDTKKAAEYSQTSIVDMADNANKMGTDMSSIQNAYQGFAKQNYTMLDNLKLGYGGTKDEMKRLINDAAKVNSSVKMDDMSFDNIVQAVHTIQKQLNISGTTANEAEGTLTGSLSTVKSTWENLMTSLVTGGDSFDQCMDNFITSANTFGSNMLPAIQKGLGGVGRLIEETAPLIEQNLPNIINTLLPPLLKAASAVVSGIVTK